MHDLRLIGVHDDGEHLVLTAADGEKYRLRVDEPLRAAVRRDRPRLGQLQMELNGTLRPKEIQSRIRAGQTAEEIAEISGLSVEHIRRYEGPVLAEREFVATQARGVRMRGISRLDGTIPTLGELVTERLAAREAEIGDDAWDARRGEDGVWIVSLAFEAASRPRYARWAYDPALRHVQSQDDEARWLSEPQSEGSAPGAAVNRRLASVRPAWDSRDSRRDHVVEADVDEGQEFGDQEGFDPLDGPSSTVDLLDSLRERRGRRQRPMPDLDTDEDDDLFERAPVHSRRTPTDVPSWRHSPDIPAAHPPKSRPDLADDAEVLELPASDVTPASVAGWDLLHDNDFEDDELSRGDSRASNRRADQQRSDQSHNDQHYADRILSTSNRPESIRHDDAESAEDQLDQYEAQSRSDDADSDASVEAVSERARPGLKPARESKGGSRRNADRARMPQVARSGAAEARSSHPTVTRPERSERRGSHANQRPAVAASDSARDTALTGAAEHPAAETPQGTAPAAPKRGKRASVPSWDDIVFGGRRE